MIWLFLSLLSFAAGPQETYDENSRINYIEKGLRAVSEEALGSKLDVLRTLRAMGSAKCRAATLTLKLSCLLESAQEICRASKSKGCLAISDLVISNYMNEEEFLTRRDLLTTLRHVSGATDHTTTILMSRYARNAAEMLSTDARKCGDDDFGCLSKGINRYCESQGRLKGLSWNACASSIVWFIGINWRKG